jgi:hypothetical protein
MTRKLLNLIFLMLLISVLISGCVNKGIKMDKISERTDGSRHIIGYADPVKKYIHVTVVENTGITDFGVEGLQKEILWLLAEIFESCSVFIFNCIIVAARVHIHITTVTPGQEHICSRL